MFFSQGMSDSEIDDLIPAYNTRRRSSLRNKPKMSQQSSPSPRRRQAGQRTPARENKTQRLYPDLRDEYGDEDDLENLDPDSEGTEEEECDEENEDSPDSPNMPRRNRYINENIKARKPLRKTKDHQPMDRFNDEERVRDRHRGNRRRDRISDGSNLRSEGNTSESFFSCKTFILILAALCIAAGIIQVVTKKDDMADTPKEERIDFYKLFKPKFDQVRKQYPSQTTRFWRVIGSSLKRVMNEPYPSYPAVIIITVPQDSSAVGTCLAKELAKNVNKVFNLKPSYIDASKLDNRTPEKMKLALDNELTDVLSVARAVVIDHIEQLKSEAGLLLHGYSDGDNAPYKDSAIFLVLHTNLREMDESGRLTEDYLTKLWGGVLGVDEMPALLSRIANSVAALSPEEGVKC